MIEALFFTVAVLIAAYLLAPAFRHQVLPDADSRDALEAARDAALRALHDLDLDWQTGKLSERDYRATRAILEAEASEVLRQLVRPGAGQ
ncbi:MAG: hypothetical protein FJX73_00235 [Armatimonadetes bacterium]|nr:hypothetical protein [Armatimonadota bacterium]